MGMRPGIARPELSLTREFPHREWERTSAGEHGSSFHHGWFIGWKSGSLQPQPSSSTLTGLGADTLTMGALLLGMSLVTCWAMVCGGIWRM